MISTAYKLNNRLSDLVVAQTIVAGFTGQLKGWWDNYLTFDDINSILKAYRINENSEIVKDKNDQDIEEYIYIYLKLKYFFRYLKKIIKHNLKYIKYFRKFYNKLRIKKN